MAFGTKPAQAQAGQPITAAQHNALMYWSSQGRNNTNVNAGDSINPKRVRVEAQSGNYVLGTYTSFGSSGTPITAAEFNRVLNYYG